jgi:hypothetical protein
VVLRHRDNFIFRINLPFYVHCLLCVPN